MSGRLLAIAPSNMAFLPNFRPASASPTVAPSTICVIESIFLTRCNHQAITPSSLKPSLLTGPDNHSSTGPIKPSPLPQSQPQLHPTKQFLPPKPPGQHPRPTPI